MPDTVQPQITLHPLTDDAAEEPEWVLERLKALVATGHGFGAGFASARGTHPDVDDAWVYVATAAQHDDQWQVHLSYIDAKGEQHEAAFAADIAPGARFRRLNRGFDKLLAAYIAETHRMPSETTAVALAKWANEKRLQEAATLRGGGAE